MSISPLQLHAMMVQHSEVLAEISTGCYKLMTLYCEALVKRQSRLVWDPLVE